MKTTYKISIQGTVQGVGFRPFVYSLAHRYALTGTISNGAKGVEISINALEDIIKAFVASITQELPPLAKIDSLDISAIEYKEIISNTITGLEKELTNVSKQRNILIEKVDKKVLAFYEKIRKWAGNTTVVPVRKQACYGCFMRINDKTYSTVIKHDDIVTCPHCGRILYKEVEAEKVEQEQA